MDNSIFQRVQFPYKTVAHGQFRAFLLRRVFTSIAFVFIITTTYIQFIEPMISPAQSSLDLPIDTSKFQHPRREIRQHRLPRAIIAGVSKCGTRALLEFMTLHPNIVGPGKEISFFNNLTFFKQGIDAYRLQMPRSYSNQITVEKSPDYFECTLCPDRIMETIEDVKLIFILCNPIERLLSQYMQARSEGLKETFEDWVVNSYTGNIRRYSHHIRSGHYDEYIAYWLRFFPRSQMLVIDGTRLQKHPVHELRKVEKFLGLRPYISSDDIYFNETRGFHCMYRDRNTKESVCLGSNKGRRHDYVSPDIYEKLQELYLPHNKRLEHKFLQELNL